MTENEFILSDRLQKIRQIINQYGEENFYISFSGGKDSTVLSKLVDMAIPSNNIPRVYADTGIELNMIRDFVCSMAEWDWRVKIIKPSTPIIPMLEAEGYPFKSKVFSRYIDRFRRIGYTKSVLVFVGRGSKTWGSRYSCPSKLQYLFSQDYWYDFPISAKCCDRLKKDNFHKYSKFSGRKYGISGIMRSEGGGRDKAECLVFSNKKLIRFQPMSILTKDWEEWFIEKYNDEICDIYKEPYNFPRTGCKGCPFAIQLQHELDVLQEHFPAERKQCEIIWKPVYDEYRRIGYRLKDKYDIEKGMPL